MSSVNATTIATGEKQLHLKDGQRHNCALLLVNMLRIVLILFAVGGSLASLNLVQESIYVGGCPLYVPSPDTPPITPNSSKISYQSSSGVSCVLTLYVEGIAIVYLLALAVAIFIKVTLGLTLSNIVALVSALSLAVMLICKVISFMTLLSGWGMTCHNIKCKQIPSFGKMTSALINSLFSLVLVIIICVISVFTTYANRRAARRSGTTEYTPLLNHGGYQKIPS